MFKCLVCGIDFYFICNSCCKNFLYFDFNIFVNKINLSKPNSNGFVIFPFFDYSVLLLCIKKLYTFNIDIYTFYINFIDNIYIKFIEYINLLICYFNYKDLAFIFLPSSGFINNYFYSRVLEYFKLDIDFSNISIRNDVFKTVSFKFLNRQKNFSNNDRFIYIDSNIIINKNISIDTYNGVKVFIIDDIQTTGATLQYCEYSFKERFLNYDTVVLLSLFSL